MVAGPEYRTVGPKSDGSVLAAGALRFDYGQCNVGGWMLKSTFPRTSALMGGGTVIQ